MDESSLSSPTISEIDENHRKLFIQNISYSTDESTLYSFFSTYVYLKLSIYFREQFLICVFVETVINLLKDMDLLLLVQLKQQKHA